jgi:hypothetical protein
MAIEWHERASTLCADSEDKKKRDERLKLYKNKKPYRDEGISGKGERRQLRCGVHSYWRL